MVEDTLEERGFTLPPFPRPAGNYVPCVRTGNLVYISGMLPMKDGAVLVKGPVGGDACTVEDARRAAAQCALNILAVVKEAAGSFENVARLVQIQGFVYGVPGFAESPQVLNGASDLFIEALGESGRHTRAAVTVAGLPMGAAVEITAIVALRG